MPYSRADISFLPKGCELAISSDYYGVNALSGLYLISTIAISSTFWFLQKGVNALSGLYLISTGEKHNFARPWSMVSMPSRAYTSFLRLYYYHLYQKCIVSMPSRAYTSFLRYPFKNLGFMRFPEPVFAGIYQNILTTAVFRAC